LKENSEEQEDKQLVEDYYYEALAITTVRNMLVFDEERMRPETTTEEPKMQE